MPTDRHRGHPPPLSVAPMMDVTDRWFRRFIRLITKRTLLYTEMITWQALTHGDEARLLGFDAVERPVALQLGGDSPNDLARCAKLGEDYGYDEINLNVGCPSPRVSKGNFGACLMLEPDTVAACVRAMRAAVSVPVTVKHRIGVDSQDRYEDMLRFVDAVAEAGCDRFVVHARKAWLTGLSPKENRTVPPLRYDDVFRLKAERPSLRIEVNGGVRTIERAREYIAHVDGVMIGRGAAEDPMMLAAADAAMFGGGGAQPTHADVARGLVELAREVRGRGVRLHRLTRHALPLFARVPGAAAWRRALTHLGQQVDAGADGVEVAVAAMLEAERGVGA